MKRVQSVKSLSLISSKPMGLLLFRVENSFSFLSMILRRVNPVYSSIKSDTVRFFLYHNLKNTLHQHHSHTQIFNFKSYSYNTKNKLEFLQKSFDTEASISTFLRTLVNQTSNDSLDLNHHQFKLFNYHSNTSTPLSFVEERRINLTNNSFNHSTNSHPQIHSSKIPTLIANKQEKFELNKIYAEETKRSQIKNVFNHSHSSQPQIHSHKVAILTNNSQKRVKVNKSYREETKINQIKNVFNHSHSSQSQTHLHKVQLLMANSQKRIEVNKTYDEETKTNQIRNVFDHSKYLYNLNQNSIHHTPDNTNVEIIYKKEPNRQKKHIPKLSSDVKLEEKSHSTSSDIVNGIVSTNHPKENIESIVNHVETSIIENISDDVMVKIEDRWSREIMRRGGDYAR